MSYRIDWDLSLHRLLRICLFLGSDSFFEDKNMWMIGSILTFIEALIFTIVMLMLEANDETYDVNTLQMMRTEGKAYNLTYIMLCAFVANCIMY